MKIRQYMTSKLIKTTPEMSVKDAFLLMRTHRVRHLPVVEGDKLAGIISDRDLRRPKWAESLDDWTSYYQVDEDTHVRDVMTNNPEVVHTYDPIRKAVDIFRGRRYGALPVLDKTEDLVGILSAHDLLTALWELLMLQPKENKRTK